MKTIIACFVIAIFGMGFLIYNTFKTTDIYGLDKLYVGDSRGNIYKVTAGSLGWYGLQKCDEVKNSRCIVYLKGNE
jgi:hypothetical protein